MSYSYDGIGNLTKAEDDDSKVEFTYDGRNLVVTATTTDKDAQPFVTLTNAYNAVGDRTSLGDGSATESFEYDGAGRLSKLPSWPTWVGAVQSGPNLFHQSEQMRVDVALPQLRQCCDLACRLYL